MRVKQYYLCLSFNLIFTMKKLLFISFLLFSIASVAQNSIQQKLEEVLKNDALKNAAISICVTETKNDSILLVANPQMCLVPASVEKLITSATAFEILGGDKQFATTVWADGEIINRKLTGNLIITGGGDPTLGSENFDENGLGKRFLSEWVHWIKNAGIDTITGNIIADPGIFPENDIPGSWLWEDIGNYYGAIASGISIYDNIFEVTFNVPSQVGDTAVIVKTDPEIPGLQFQNEVISTSQKGDNAYVFGSPLDKIRLIKGTLPAGSTGYKVKASIPDPALVLATELKMALADSAVWVSGVAEKKSIAKTTPIDTSHIVTLWVSPPLYAIAERMNKESNNLYAETLMKQTGLKISGDASTKAGTKAIAEFWTSKGIGLNSLFLADGSGLSRANAFSAKTLVDVLVYMKNESQWFEQFHNSIPLTGVEGTQKYYFQESKLKGKARAKTGSMTRVRNMAGYMTTKRGKEIAFAIMINNYNNSIVVKNQIEKLMENIYSEF